MIKAITVGVKHHINLGNYESMEVEAQVLMDLGDSDNANEVFEEAQKTLTILLDKTFQAQKKPAWFAEIPIKRARTV